MLVRRSLLASFVLLTGCPAQPDDEPCTYALPAGNCVEVERAVVFDDARVDAITPSSLPAAASPCRAPERARVQRAIDGDTFEVLLDDGTTERIRLIGVDTPETHPPDGGLPHCFGYDAALFSGQLVGRRVLLTFDRDCEDSTASNRSLAYLWIGSGTQDLWQTQLLRRGFARQLTVRPNDAFEATLAADELFARTPPQGLWDECVSAP